MNARVQYFFTPNTDTMRSHVEHLFGGYLDGCHEGLIELAWTDPGTRKLSHARLFGTDKLDELVEEAARLNAQPMCNVYIGAALRHPDTPPFGRAKDSDAWALTCGYADLDDAQATKKAKDIYGKDKPTMVVLTGRDPHMRAQTWWRLDEPLKDSSQWPTLLRGIAAKLNGDRTVTNPARVMRLAGSVAWPVKDGRVTELTSIAPIVEPGLSEYSFEHLARVFPPVESTVERALATVDARQSGLNHTTNSLGLTDKIDDGREDYMHRTVAACLVELIGSTGCCPTPQELYDVVWPQYERKVDLTRAGRGSEECAEKCAYTVARFERGDIRGIETLDKAIEVYRRKAERKPAPAVEAPRPIDPKTGKELPLLLSAAQFMSAWTPPEYLIDGVIQRGCLYSITAPTGHGKTAVTMYLSQCICQGREMHGKEVKRGTVLFLAGENPDDIRARYLVLAQHYGFDAMKLPMRFVAGVIDVAASMPTIKAEADLIDDLVLVIVDTAAAYFKGDDGNSNAQQGEYARLLRQLTFLPGKPTVLVNCHPTKNAKRDNLTPVGGGAFLNEVDGNLTLWANSEKQASLHWMGKFRGPEFEPMAFEMETVTSPNVVDSKGRLMPSVIAKPIGEMALRRGEVGQEDDENLILKIISASPRASLADIAAAADFIDSKGHPMKSKVVRVINRLLEDKMVEKHRGSKYRTTKKGKKELGIEDDEG